MKNEVEVLNLDAKPLIRRSVEMFSNTMKTGIQDSSGCRKTNIILLHKNLLVTIYICSRTLNQEKYKLLNEPIEDYNKNKRRKKIQFCKFMNVNDLPTRS